MLSEDERSQVLSALWQWASSVPDVPVMGFLEGHGPLTPRQLADAVERGTPDGEALLEILEHGVRREGIELVVQRLVDTTVRATSLAVVLDEIRAQTGLNLYLSSGPQPEPGDVVDVKSGTATVVADARSLLGRLELRQSTPSDLYDQADASIRIGTKGLEIEFQSDVGWVLAARGYMEMSLSRRALRDAILDAFGRNAWDPEWAVVDSVGTAERFTLLAPGGPHASVALEFGENYDQSPPAMALTAAPYVVASRDMTIQLIVEHPRVVTRSVARIPKRWLFADAPADDRIWEDVPVLAEEEALTLAEREGT